jgi:Rieske Fe-S protein
MKRKKFLHVMGGACLSITGLPVLFSGCTSIHKVSALTTNNKLIISRNEFIEVKKGAKSSRELILVRAATLTFPIVVYTVTENEFTALWMECTHKSCEVNAYPGYLVCPCHGSEFDANGNVTQGPAESNLKTFNVTSDHENIYIHL